MKKMSKISNIDKSRNEYQNNFWKFYSYRFISSLTFISPIFFLYVLGKGISMTQLMFLQSFYCVIIFLANIPVGAFADRFGIKKVGIISVLCWGIGIIIYGSGNTFWVFMIAEFVLAFSSAGWRAFDSPFIYENLVELKKQHRYKKYEGITQLLSSFGFGIGSLAGGFVAAKYGLTLPFFLSVIPISIGLIFLLSLKNVKIHKKESYSLKIKNSVRYIRNHHSLGFFMMITALLSACSFSVFIFYQPYLKELGLSIGLFGLFYLIMNAVLGLSSFFAGEVEKKVGERLSLFCIYFFITIIPLILLINKSIVAGFILLILMSFFFGVGNVLTIHHINFHSPSSKRATLVSMTFFLSNILCAVILPVFGILSDKISISFGLFTVGFFSFAALILLTIFYSIKKESLFQKEEGQDE